jgi:hypothetical protein
VLPPARLPRHQHRADFESGRHEHRPHLSLLREQGSDHRRHRRPDLDRLLTLTAELRAASDVKSAMLERAVEGVEDNLDPGTAGLQLEIVAEAARNPRVADIVRTADRQCRDSLRETIRTQRVAAGHRDSEATLSGMTEALAAMFEGLQIRTIRNPELDQDAVVQTFRRLIHDLLSQTP